MRITILERNSLSRVVVVDKDPIGIGRSLTNDIVLTAPSVDPSHARVERYEDGERFVVRDLDSAFGIWFRGERLRDPIVLDPGDVVWIGPYDLRFGDASADTLPPSNVWVQEVPRVDPVEQRFLEMIDQRPYDDDNRAVYADWLEENGRDAEAEMLRVQLALKGMAPENPFFLGFTQRLKTLARALPPGWRRVVARPTIERCDVRFELQCPKRWDALAPTNTPDIRFCGACNKHVYYAASIVEAREHARAQRCVAVDVAAERSPRDLDPPARRMYTGMLA